MYRSFGLTQKNQKVKAAPSGLLRFAAVGKWMKLASLKQHPFLFRPPRRSASRPSAEGRSLSSLLGRSCSKAGSFPPHWKLLFRTYRSLSESEPFLLTSDCSCSKAALSSSLESALSIVSLLIRVSTLLYDYGSSRAKRQKVS